MVVPMHAVVRTLVVVALPLTGACKDTKKKPAADGDAQRSADEKPAKVVGNTPQAIASASALQAPDAPKAGPNGARTWTFEKVPKGSLPAGFRLDETASSGTRATWSVVAADDAPSPASVFGVTATENPKTTYNLAVVQGVSTADIDISVMVKAVSGDLDQGGGPVWRFIDHDNYYIARWNPLEKNARFYVVQGGVRSALAKVDLELDAEAWHSLRVVAEGSHMQLFIDDEPVLQADDTTHSRAGSIGLWTKADAATLFDDLSIARP